MTVGSYEAKTHLPQLLARVAGGEEITITKHGVPIARLVPAHDTGQRRIRETIEELKRFRKGRKLRGLSIHQLIEEGRRY